LTKRYAGRTPTSVQILAEEPEELRAAAGLSRAKVVFLRDLADRLESGSLRLDDIEEAPDDEVASRLLEVKGVGQWTVDMYLLFHLGRPDVLPVGDLGIRRAAMLAYRLRKLPQPERLVKLARPWRPWRSVASWYLWASLRVVPV
jgi:DNA-3-methyladenine glycosylase II